MYEWLDDYSDTSKVCWASDSKMVVAECWCAQCQEAMKLLPLYELANSNAEIGLNFKIEAAAFEASMKHTEAQFRKAQDKLEAVEAWIEERVENDELTDEIKELAEAIDYELMEEVEVTLTMSMIVTIKKPVGTDVDDTDFWTFSNDWIESTYEIVSTEDLSVDCAE
jgi:predicted DNA-binding protein YlxM (UPF0122 family)